MACTTACPTQDHQSWGECARSKSLKTAVSIPGNGYDRSREKAWESRLDSYRTARSEGIQPKSTRATDIKSAVAHSDATGTAFRAQ